MFLIPRRLHPEVAEALDRLPPASLPRPRGEGSAADFERRMQASLSERGTGPAWLAARLLDALDEGR